jgi:3'-phosphoadenosine 5'-phosphosulfate (PAPS) 3'-phosphatase
MISPYYTHYCREKIWDHCAGFVIVEEAGGCVTDAGGNRLDFSHGRYLKLDRWVLSYIAYTPLTRCQLGCGCLLQMSSSQDSCG